MKPAPILAAFTVTPAVSAAQATCHDYVIISIRGTYEPQGRSIAFTTMINQTFAAIPGGIEYDAVYPAAADQTAYLGADDVTRFLDNGLQECPRQQYAILGYSQGASATMLTLNNITDTSSAAYKAIKAVLVTGNPYHVPNASANVDENGGDASKNYPGALYNANSASSRGIPQTYYDSGALLDICHQDDSVCAPKAPNASFIPGHLHYGDQNVQDLGAKFLISRFSANDNNSSPTSTAAASSSSSLGLPTGSPTGSEPSQNTGGANMVSMSFVAALGGVFALLLQGC
ncbi:alpha/beta-hydrolase [Paraphaeosphaeria sporulosa]|uniref:Alpha/beta-hydrolase n=1 Tax=Paraphaeosphaeria sporulosa TaxID=1460663 RepID=A0A177BVX6_9PLEO|nr:alpha/beta-hydrolase [Paraphaeosphaeria sporulosa]OAF99265.1 alpha/beta-hydrolase [Paraphaeosphaeria sporulosa]